MWRPLCHWDCQKRLAKFRPCHSGCAIGIVKNGLPKSNHVIVAVPLGLSKQFVKTSLCNSRCTKLGLSKKFVKRSLCNGRCTIGIRDAETFNKGYMTRAVPLGLPKKVSKRSLCNSRCAIGIPDAENFEKRYMAHAVPLVLVANLFVKSSNISVCPMSRLNLVTFRFFVGGRYFIGIVTKWCDFPPCDVTFLHLAVTLGDMTFRRVMWLKPGACMWTWTL